MLSTFRYGCPLMAKISVKAGVIAWMKLWGMAGLLLLLVLPGTGFAQHVSADIPISPIYAARSNQLLTLAQEAEAKPAFFARSFLEAIPEKQIRQNFRDLENQFGKPEFVRRIIAQGPYSGTVEIKYRRGVVAFNLVLDRSSPHKVIGMRFVGSNTANDDFSSLTKIFRNLPGSAGFQIAQLTAAGPVSLHEHNARHTYGIASVFKLYVLAELTRSIRAGERSWKDTLPLTQKSLPSGIIRNWPTGTPLTLQTLATLMISISDNSATDILIKELGRNNIGRLVKDTGHSNISAILPVLTTLEFFALKMPANADLRQRYIRANDEAQRRILATSQDRLGMDDVEAANLANKPRYIDEIEWFAAPQDITLVLHYIHLLNDPVARAILSIDPIIPAGDKARWVNLGGKGGNEPGVISFAFLGQSRSGRMLAISGSWNNAVQEVDKKRFRLLMNRLLNLTAERY